MFHSQRARIFLSILFFVCSNTAAAYAASVQDAHTEVELISDVLSIQPGRPFWVAVHLKMEEAWHTYWENPGDSGMAVKVQWQLPGNFQAGPLQWPFPRREDYPGGITSYVHDNEVFLLSEITPSSDVNAGNRASLKAGVRWLVCDKICVPGKASLELVLPVENNIPEIDQRVHREFEEARDRWPLKESAWEITVRETEKEFYLHLNWKGDGSLPALGDVSFFPLRGDIIEHAARQTLEKYKNGYRLAVPKSGGAAEKAGQLEGVLVFARGTEGLEGRRALMIDRSVKAVE